MCVCVDQNFHFGFVVAIMLAGVTPLEPRGTTRNQGTTKDRGNQSNRATKVKMDHNEPRATKEESKGNQRGPNGTKRDQQEPSDANRRSIAHAPGRINARTWRRRCRREKGRRVLGRERASSSCTGSRGWPSSPHSASSLLACRFPACTAHTQCSVVSDRVRSTM